MSDFEPYRLQKADSGRLTDHQAVGLINKLLSFVNNGRSGETFAWPNSDLPTSRRQMVAAFRVHAETLIQSRTFTDEDLESLRLSFCYLACFYPPKELAGARKHKVDPIAGTGSQADLAARLYVEMGEFLDDLKKAHDASPTPSTTVSLSAPNRHSGGSWPLILKSLAGIAIVAAFIWSSYVVAFFEYLSAPQSVKSAASDAHLSIKGSKLFWNLSPRHVDKPTIAKACSQATGPGHLLGCYTGDRIYLQYLAEPELRPVLAGAVAHEMLHAAYDDITGDEKARINALLSTQLNTRGDQQLNAQVGAYGKPEEQLSEAFAILGSEAPYSSLPSGLNQVYDRYFSDRVTLLAMHQSFQRQQDDIVQKINDCKSRLDYLASVGDVYTHNNLVPECNQYIEKHNSLVTKFQSAIGQ